MAKDVSRLGLGKKSYQRRTLMPTMTMAKGKFRLAENRKEIPPLSHPPWL
jgi:hypothetical protein